jgi:hypothetical protein
VYLAIRSVVRWTLALAVLLAGAAVIYAVQATDTSGEFNIEN